MAEEQNSRSTAAMYQAKHGNEIDDYNNKFRDRLAEARSAKGFTQKDMADKLDVELVTYRGYEQGVSRKDIPYYIASLANVLDVSADYLVGLSEKPHPEYDSVIKSTGLNERAIHQLQQLHLQDGDEEIYHGYMDFINCFLGNGECTALFLQSLLPVLRGLADSICGGHPSEDAEDQMMAQLNRHVSNYLRKVVVPTFAGLYSSGSFTPASVPEYMTDDAGKKRKRAL